MFVSFVVRVKGGSRLSKQKEREKVSKAIIVLAWLLPLILLAVTGCGDGGGGKY